MPGQGEKKPRSRAGCTGHKTNGTVNSTAAPSAVQPAERHHANGVRSKAKPGLGPVSRMRLKLIRRSPENTELLRILGEALPDDQPRRRPK
jgi:hypothetical protein